VPADNLTMPDSDTSVEDMIADTERALLLTTLWYVRTVDPATLLLTGPTRDGVYLVEDGRWPRPSTTSGSTKARPTCLPVRPRSVPTSSRSHASGATTRCAR
jgi:PmbA/TldA metallopeptidase C-terminal domain